jgi:hypothetical protein
MPTNAVGGLRAAFDEADIDPATIAFPEGPNVYLEEVARSSAHPRSAQAARRLLRRSQETDLGWEALRSLATSYRSDALWRE